ncbi:bifunctional chorismate mutase/prephenate dehydratase [Hyalangium gracile]|uniref:bifunctional chorismate mutase/prephenate dehydratase n=1 Tax=Hyalangium gracile TaxID=394092 RepID=UPI001CCE4AF9|nr:prephenate dehydratase domain-containing protein [Hyalangium gracile]
MADLPDLDTLRIGIERIDSEILDALRRRMDLADDIARAKLAAASPLRDPTREDLVLRKVREAATSHGLDPHEIERIFRLIMDMSVARQQALIQRLDTTPLRVGYPGIEGSYSHMAARDRYAGRQGGVLLTGFETGREAMDALRRGELDLALLPIENTSAGSMSETYDLLAAGSVTIIGEMLSQVDHRLLGLPGARLEDIRTVLSHPQALAQCELFLRKVPWIRPLPEFDTSGAAQKVRERNDPTIAAIASESAAQRFGLQVLARDLQPASGDYTRFVELAREAAPVPPDVPCKTTLTVVLEHRPGTLGQVLTTLAQRGVNLSKLESRPIPGEPWRYRFYLDVEGHAASAPLIAAFEDLQPLTSSMKVLGTYPRAENWHG